MGENIEALNYNSIIYNTYSPHWKLRISFHEILTPTPMGMVGILGTVDMLAGK